MTPEHLAMLSGWTVETVETKGGEVRFLLRRNNRRREAVVRDGMLHVADLHYLSRDADLRVYRTWYTFAAVVQAHPHPLAAWEQTNESNQALGVRCSVTGATLWIGLSTLRKHMTDTEPHLPLSYEGYYDVLTRLCERGESSSPAS